MNLPKVMRGLEGRNDLIVDASVLLQALQGLEGDQVEFPIKVEGTSTLPYASQVVGLEPERGALLLKLVRPLPHELASGAPFIMVFPWQDQRFEAEIHYLERESYLRYRFECPKAMWPSDRRRHPRFPFRPREAPYVLAQDAGVPGRVIGGPVLNLSQGGALVRVDRVLRLDTGIRVPVQTALFDRGLGLSRIRLQDLPRLPLLEVRGAVAHVFDHGEEVLVGIAFGELDEEEARALRESLAFRQAVQSAPGRSRAAEVEGGPLLSPGNAGGHGPGPATEEALLQPSGTAAAGGEDPRRGLARREVRGLLVAEPGPRRDRILAVLRGLGYARLDAVPDAAAVGAALGRSAAPALLLMDLHPLLASEEEPLAVFRSIEPQIRAWGERPTALICPSLDPALQMVQGAHLHFLDEECPELWGAVLDGLTGISAS